MLGIGYRMVSIYIYLRKYYIFTIICVSMYGVRFDQQAGLLYSTQI